MRLPALEKNILVYRALQMALFLFYAEDLRRFIVETLEPVVKRHSKAAELKGAKLLKKIFAMLVSDKVISLEESNELQQLLAHRNTIAHEIHMLTGDIQAPGLPYGFRESLRLRYDYSALNRMKKWHKVLPTRFMAKYIMVVSFSGVLFDAAESAYERELVSLKRRIDKQFMQRKKAL
jgi:hypothetical protein